MGKFPQASGTGLIYMVGCIVKNNLTHETFYLNYLVDALDSKCECQMIRDWLQDLQQMIDDNNVAHTKRHTTFPKINLIHWSSAESYHLQHCLEEYCNDITTNYNIEFIDLYQLFKTHRVALPGCFNYGLKNIAQALYRQGKIHTIWPNDIDGTQAMVAAWYAYKTAQQQNKTLSEIEAMEEIIRYNFTDCKVLEEIVDYLRQLDS